VSLWITWTDEDSMCDEERQARMALFAAEEKRARKAAKRLRDAERMAAARAAKKGGKP
jgi:hypothetical protein